MKRIFGLVQVSVLLTGLALAQTGGAGGSGGGAGAGTTGGTATTTERTDKDNDWNLGWLGLLGLAGLLRRKPDTVVRTEHGNSRAYTPKS